MTSNTCRIIIFQPILQNLHVLKSSRFEFSRFDISGIADVDFETTSDGILWVLSRCISVVIGTSSMIWQVFLGVFVYIYRLHAFW